MNTSGAGELLGFLLAVLIIIALIANKVSAADLLDPNMVTSETIKTESSTEMEEEENNVPTTEEVREIIEYSFELNQPVEVIPVEPVPVYQLNPDDYNGSLISTFAINGNVYSGSYNSTIISLWNGLLQNNIGKDYLAYRASQYEYYIFFGEGFEYSGGEFTGSGTYHYYNTYGNKYGYDVGSDSFSVDPGSNYVYTNVCSDFPGLEVERGLLYEQIQIVMLGSVLFIIMFKWIFSGR